MTRPEQRATVLTRHIAGRIRELRKERRLSGGALAKRMQAAGVNWIAPTVAKLENGRRERLSVDELVAVAEVLGVTPAALLPASSPATVETHLNTALAAIHEAMSAAAARSVPTVRQHDDHDRHGLVLWVWPNGCVTRDDPDCECPADCAGCREGAAL